MNVLNQKKTNSLISLTNEQDDIDKIYLYAKDLSEPQYEYLIKKRKNSVIKHFNDLNAPIECSNTLDDVYKNIDDYKPSRKRKILIVFDEWLQTLKAIKSCSSK